MRGLTVFSGKKTWTRTFLGGQGETFENNLLKNSVNMYWIIIVNSRPLRFHSKVLRWQCSPEQTFAWNTRRRAWGGRTSQPKECHCPWTPTPLHHRLPWVTRESPSSLKCTWFTKDKKPTSITWGFSILIILLIVIFWSTHAMFNSDCGDV